MTNKPVKSRVCWITKEAGGRESPPQGPRYSTAARFEEEKDKWPHEAWSLILEFSGPLDETLCVIADVSLLNPDGPARRSISISMRKWTILDKKEKERELLPRVSKGAPGPG